MAKEIKQILKANPSLQLIDDGNKVKCNLSGHEMPCRLDVLQTYIGGKKYERLRGKAALEMYSEFLAPTTHRVRKNQLFCKLTLRHVNNLPHHIEQHVKGKRFQKAHKEWLRCQEAGVPFVPFSRRNKRRIEDGESDREDGESGADDAGSDADSLADFYPNDEQVEGQGDDDAYDFDNMEGAGQAHHSGNGNGVEDGENGAVREPPKKKMKKPHQDTLKVQDSTTSSSKAKKVKHNKKKVASKVR